MRLIPPIFSQRRVGGMYTLYTHGSREAYGRHTPGYTPPTKGG